MNEDESYYIECEGIDVCESCYCNNYTMIDYGSGSGDIVPNDEAVYIDNGRRSGYYRIDDDEVIECDEDSEYVHIDNIIFDEDGYSYHVRNEDVSWFRDPVDDCIYAVCEGIKVNNVWVKTENEEDYIEQNREEEAKKLTIPLPLVFEEKTVEQTPA